MNINPLCFTFVILCGFAINVTTAIGANPSHKPEEQDQPIAVRDKAYSEGLVKQAQALCESAGKSNEEYRRSVDGGEAGKLSNKLLCQTYVDVNQVKRLSDMLVIRGETAGHDYAYRYAGLRLYLLHAIEQWRRDPRSSRVLEQLRAQSSKTASVRTKNAAKLQQLIDKEQWERAEEFMNECADDAVSDYVVLQPEIYRGVMAPYKDVIPIIQNAMKQKRSQEAHEALLDQLEKEKPDFAAALAKIESAVSLIGSSGTAIWDEAHVNGPQLVEKIGDQWAAIQVQSIRCRTCLWLLASTGRQSYEEGATARAAPKLEVENEFEKFSTAVKKSLAKLVKADAARVSTSEAESLYVDYLKSLAVIQRLAFDDFATELTAALADLAGKSPALKQKVDNYNLATGELLRWKKRVADSAAQARAKDFVPVAPENYKALTLTADTGGLYPTMNSNINDARLLSTTPQVMSRATELMLNKKVTARDLVRFSPKYEKLVGRYGDRIYVTVDAVDQNILNRHLDALKSGLMVTDQQGPLSLTAASAIETMARSDLRSAGGAVSGIYLESLATRFGTLPESVAVIAEYGRLPYEPETVSASAATHALMRYQIEPAWVECDYAFIDLTKEAAVETPNPAS